MVWQVAVIAFDGISPFHLAVPSLVLGEMATGETPRFNVTVCAEQATCRTSAGFDIQLKADLSIIAHADIVIVPSWHDPNQPPSAALISVLQAAHARRAQIIGLCLGAYVLAAAGLLDGVCATTHWAFAVDFAQRYPRVVLKPEVLYVSQDNLLTSAGTAAALDCCLHCVRERYGMRVANDTARRLVMPAHRQGGQAQYITHALPMLRQGHPFSELLDEIRANVAVSYRLDDLAHRFCMSRRTFSRHWHATTGTSFGTWLQIQRLAHSQMLLETTSLPISSVAEKSGFGSVETLRYHFQRAFALSPTQWRQVFRPTSD